ncbi:hypothetical protein CIL03_11465 [Virgibacillus indicus]|uniref:2-dehydro-3-deoxygalactonokinase n=1 Tax=Virgibacillus indicus TaxID=2024554 RepID=A0A265N8X1_9BACI|nr:2-dehydro-3-deoxygalactonokinase [Virgibacillus indicus]OZU88265.1 hypothetical protein CIL03_11465 [Virgibacillus indicus]
MYIILIDSGTTNSRIRLVHEESTQLIDIIKIEVGIRNTAIDGNNHSLKSEITQGIRELVRKNKLETAQINYIIASGMITSNLGLYEVDHVTAPADLEDFVHHSKTVISEDFYHIPCLFVPGMKNRHDVSDEGSVIDQMDILRGEEVETIGLLEQLKPAGKGLMILPGSHTKYLLIDEDQTFLSSFSTLGGEVLHSISSSTILSDSLNTTLIESLNRHQLIEGYKAAKKVGLTRSFYHIRLLQLFSELDDNERANYFVGAVLQSDMQALHSFIGNEENLDWFVVGGASPLRAAFVQLLKEEYQEMDIIEASNEQIENALIYGAHRIGRNYVENQNEKQ